MSPLSPPISLSPLINLLPQASGIVIIRNNDPELSHEGTTDNSSEHGPLKTMHTPVVLQVRSRIREQKEQEIMLDSRIRHLKNQDNLIQKNIDKARSYVYKRQQFSRERSLTQINREHEVQKKNQASKQMYQRVQTLREQERQLNTRSIYL